MSDVDGRTDDSKRQHLRPELGPRFQTLKCLGSGGMGDVYLAEDTELHRKVAIKMVRPDLSQNAEIRKRIERECLLHAKVGPHPHIVTLFDKIEQQGRIHLIMEYVEGETLYRLLERKCREHAGAALPLDDAAQLVAQCLEALSRIHSAGIVHRDIKPANIMVARDDADRPCAKLMDFGIARMQDTAEALTQLTTTHGGSPGTPLYMSPEQIDSKTFGAVSFATDIYAIGILLYQAVSGEPPFTGTLTEILNGHINRPVPPMDPTSGGRLPTALATVIERALAKQPSDRFPSASAFREAVLALATPAAQQRTKLLETASVRAAIGAPAPPPPRSALGETPVVSATPRPPRHGPRRWVWAAVAVSALVVVAGAVWMARPQAATPDTTAEPVATLPPDAEQPSVALDPFSRFDASDNSGQSVTPQAPAAETPPLSTPDTGQVPPTIQVVVEPQEPPPAPPLTPAEPTPASLPVPAPAPTPAPAPAPAPQAGAPANGGKTYVVQPGDSLSKIAGQFGIDLVKLAQWNLLARPDTLTVGVTLYLYERPNLPKVEVILDSAKRPPADAEKGEQAQPQAAGNTPYRKTDEDLFVPTEPVKPPEQQTRKKPSRGPRP